MMPIIIIVLALVLGIVIVNPKWGTVLAWPILFTYPHGWWYNYQPLPLNIGGDDLYCLALMLAVFVRRNLMGGVPIRFGYAFWVISAFTIIAAVANAAGSMDDDPELRILYLKDIMKSGVYWALFFSVLHCIDDRRDLQIQFASFSLAAAAGAALVVLQHLFPYRMTPWTNPLTIEEALEVESRAMGAFLNPNAAGCVLSCALVLSATSVRLLKTIAGKVLVYGMMALFLVAVMLTRSRSGLMALVGAISVMAVVGRNKRVAWLIIGASILVSLTFPLLWEPFRQRVADVYDPTAGRWTQNIEGRFATWRGYLETAGPKEYLLGQGHRQGMAKNGMESHSVYVSLLTLYGVGGVIWAGAGVSVFLKKVLALRKCPDPFYAMAASGCLWVLCAWAIYGLASDAISSQYPRYILFYIVVLLDRATVMAKEVASSWSWQTSQGLSRLSYQAQYVS